MVAHVDRETPSPNGLEKPFLRWSKEREVSGEFSLVDPFSKVWPVGPSKTEVSGPIAKRWVRRVVRLDYILYDHLSHLFTIK